VFIVDINRGAAAPKLQNFRIGGNNVRNYQKDQIKAAGYGFLSTFARQNAKPPQSGGEEKG
jgi:hypothetical protein